MSVIKPRHEVILFLWNGSTHDRHNALVRSIESGDPAEKPTLNLTWMHPTNFGTNINAVQNTEDFLTKEGLDGNNYWRDRTARQGLERSLPYGTTRPTQDDIVWFIRWDEADNEEVYFKALVKEVVGGAAHPRIDLTYIRRNGTRENVNGVKAFENATPVTESYWSNRILRRGDDGFAP